MLLLSISNQFFSNIVEEWKTFKLIQDIRFDKLFRKPIPFFSVVLVSYCEFLVTCCAFLLWVLWVPRSVLICLISSTIWNHYLLFVGLISDSTTVHKIPLLARINLYSDPSMHVQCYFNSAVLCIWTCYIVNCLTWQIVYIACEFVKKSLVYYIIISRWSLVGTVTVSYTHLLLVTE